MRNEAIEEFFADLFQLPKSRVRITKGQASRRKTLEAQGISLAQARQILDAISS